MIQSVLDDKAVSNWLTMALKSALDCDPVDAVNDAELLLELLTARTAAIFDKHLSPTPVALSAVDAARPLIDYDRR